ncbi:indole-3-glycerol phosphate synthase [Halobaculum halobium]|uniref:Indole-3-glycerol phosphate synthase n=1 Tax=Halobaculum halobium TaxID=3032281 RepID=A0ABD5TEE1_9EURY|nr:indole-3-glycerol phosphate synthase [Halobaculum sp. SYNS20]
MNTRSEELAPAVRSILDAAADRPGGDERVAVDARSLSTAFATAEADGRVPVIAEVKPTSPTTDGARREDPVDLAESMVAGGAAALSVLTEPEHFGGSLDTLDRVRAAVDVPVLRKDFLVREDQLDAVEADLVLLIARFVGDDLADLVAAARDRGFQPLVEVHTREELAAALAAGAELIGVNNRDLGKLAVDLSTFEAIAPEVPDGVTLIAESGIATPADVQRMRDAGADGLLIGSAIMDAEGTDEAGTGGDVSANTRRFTAAETEEEV